MITGTSQVWEALILLVHLPSRQGDGNPRPMTVVTKKNKLREELLFYPCMVLQNRIMSEPVVGGRGRKQLWGACFLISFNSFD